MGYLFLTTALLAGAAKGYCGKKTSGIILGMSNNLLANCLRMALCTAIGFFILIFGENKSQLTPSCGLLLTAALSGVSTAFFVVTWLISVKKSAYMMLDVFLMLGILVPLLAGRFFFKEKITPTQWIGIAVLLAATLLMCSYNQSIKGKISLPSFLLLIACGLSNGITDFSQKLFVRTQTAFSVSAFNFYTYIFAGVTLLIAWTCLRQRTGSAAEFHSDESLSAKVLGYILVMSVCLFANSYFKTLAAEYLDSVLLYPLSQGGSLLLSTAMSAVLFKEKLTPKCIGGICIAFLGLLIINVL